MEVTASTSPPCLSPVSRNLRMDVESKLLLLYIYIDILGAAGRSKGSPRLCPINSPIRAAPLASVVGVIGVQVHHLTAP